VERHINLDTGRQRAEKLLAICRETVVLYIREKGLDEGFAILLRDEEGWMTAKTTTGTEGNK